MSDENPQLTTAVPNAPSAPHLLRLPLELRYLILREVWPAAIHVEAAHPCRPADFRHYECDKEDHFGPDTRAAQCGSLVESGYYDDKMYREAEDNKQTFFFPRPGSAWRNHWACEWFGTKKTEDLELVIYSERIEDCPPSNFMPILLACRQLYSEAIRCIGHHVTFCFTDLWTPVEFFAGPRSPPVSRHIRTLWLTASPFHPPRTGLWTKFLASCLAPGLAELSMWLELTQPTHAVAEDGGEEYRFVRKSLSEMHIPVLGPDSRRRVHVRASVPLDPLPMEDSSASAGEEMLGNGCVVVRRGRVPKPAERGRRMDPLNEWGQTPMYPPGEECVSWVPAYRLS